MDGLAELFRKDGCGERPGSVYGRTGRYGIVASGCAQKWHALDFMPERGWCGRLVCRPGGFGSLEESSDGMHWGYFDEAHFAG